MEQLLKENEIKRVQDTFKGHPILLACYDLFTARMAKLNGLEISQEDIFCETANLLDQLLSNPYVCQKQVNDLWIMLLNKIRKSKPDVTEYDKQMVAGTVFQLVRAILTQHIESCYRDSICDMLIQTIERNTKDYDKEEQEEFLQKLLELSPALSKWITSYDDSDDCLSDQITNVIVYGNKRKIQDINNEFPPKQSPLNIEVSPLPSFGLSSEKQKHWSGVYYKLVLTKWLSKEEVKQLEFVYIMCAVGDMRYKPITWYGPTNALAYIVRQYLQVDGVDRWTMASKVFLDRKFNPLPESFPNTKAPSSSTMKKIDNIFKMSKE